MIYTLSQQTNFFLKDDSLIVYLSKQNKRIKFNPLILNLLILLSSKNGFTNEDFKKYATDCFIEKYSDMFKTLLKHGLIEKLDISNINLLPKESFNYINETCQYPFLNYSEGEAFFKDFSRMKKFLGKENIPPKNKKYSKIIESIKLQINLDKKKPLIYKKLNNQYEKTDFNTISNIFHYTLGIKGGINFPFQGGFLKKFVPSGGARHTTEAYLFSLEIDGLKPKSIYHYSAKENSLDLINTFNNKKILELFPEIKNIGDYSDIKFKDIKGIVVFSSIFERSMWRYRDSRSYRVILTDIGHAIENMNLLFNKLTGKKTFQGIGLIEEKVEKKLLIDSHFKESVMKYLILT